MAILDAQAMVRRPQEGLEPKNSIEPRPQNLAEKKNSFSRHLKKMSLRELEPKSRPSVRKDLPPKKTAFEISTFEQKADSIVDANGDVGKLTPAQEKPIFQAKPEDRKSSEANKSVLASVETGSTQEADKQSQNEDNVLAPTAIGLVQPQWDLTVTPESEESKTTSTVDIATVKVQGAGKQVVGQNQEPLLAIIETVQPQVAEKTAQVSVELISPVLEPAQAPSQAEANEATKPNLSGPGNPSAVTDNAILTEEPEQLAAKISTTPTLPGNTTTTALEAEQAKKAGQASDKDRMKLQFLEKPLGDQVNHKTEEPAVKDVKKIMELENHRLATRKIPVDAPAIQEIAQETGVEEGKNLILLDKTLVELAKPGGEVGKAQLPNPTQPAVSTEELMEQIVKKVELVSKQANSEMRIQLKPEFLGKMLIQIAVNDGVVTARFTTESQHVKQILEANMNSLKQTLEANGLRVDKTEVNVQLDNGGNFNNSSEGNRQQLWQEMTSRGRNTGRYSQLSTGLTGEVEEFGAYQRESDVPRVMNEGRVDFII